MTTNSRNIQVEYYDNYQLDGQTRLYEYLWPANYPVEQFFVTVQQPVNVTSIELNPSLGWWFDRPGWINLLSCRDRVPGELMKVYSLLIEYEKSDNTLSASQQSVSPSAPLDGNIEGSKSNLVTDNLPLILGILGGVLVVGGVVVALYYRNRESSPSTRGTRKRRSSSEGAIGDGYCPQCGKRSQPGDVFCRTCGSRLRRSG